MPPSADRDLAPGQFPDLNREFYAAEPGDYFRCRLRSLLLAVADSPALDEVLKQGITYGKIGLHRKPDAEPASTTVESYGSMESVNLLHHVGECMLRLYLAHADRQPCPWLELSRLRAPQEFKKRVERLRLNLSEQDTIDSLATTFFGNRQPEPLGALFTTEEWQRRVEGLVLLVAHVSAMLLDEASMYNATKHGLGVVAGRHGLRLGLGDDDAVISTDGPALSYLDLTSPDASDRRRWTKKLTFVQIESNLSLVEIITMYIDSLWALARHRYTGSAGAWQVPGFEPAFLHKVIWTGRENNVGVTSMTQTLAYHREAKAAAQPPAQPIGRRARRRRARRP
jgi:hypothetical protein